jgi:transcriptional regulator with XRE-family HTH domain
MQSKATAAPSRAEADRQQFGRNLAEARRRAKLTQEELGRRAFVSQAQISTLERGVSYPRMETLLRLADALEVPVRALLKGIG